MLLPLPKKKHRDILRLWKEAADNKEIKTGATYTHFPICYTRNYFSPRGKFQLKRNLALHCCLIRIPIKLYVQGQTIPLSFFSLRPFLQLFLFSWLTHERRYGLGREREGVIKVTTVFFLLAPPFPKSKSVDPPSPPLQLLIDRQKKKSEATPFFASPPLD